MARKTRKDSTLKNLLKKESIKPSALKGKSGGVTKSSTKVETLRKRSKNK